MKKTILLYSALLLLPTILFSQSSTLDKQLNKAKELVKQNKLDNADKYLVNLLEDNPAFGEGWDLLAEVRYREYKESEKTPNVFGNMTITTKDENGKEIPVENDSLSNKLRELLNKLDPSKMAYSKYIFTLRKGTLLANDAYNSSSLLRSIFVDPEVDTNVSKKALKYFNDAEEEFGKENYNDAAKLYKRAIEEQPDFYKASLYLGDVYYFTKQYYEAEKYFKQAVSTFPKLIEPRKYLIDTYFKQKRFDEAMGEALLGSAVYPDAALMQRIEDAVYMSNKKIDIKKILRPVFPNKVVLKTEKVELNDYEDDKKPEVKEEWVYYKNALEKIRDYCDEKGKIVKSNSLTKAAYLEVYSWEEMLSNSTSPSLEEARKMQTLGFLDCYVLISCFHFDVYTQYADFAAANSQHIKDYYDKLIR
jgi:tetratricopeptide (TPR) repeat protein